MRDASYWVCKRAVKIEGNPSWCVILYLNDERHDGDRSLVGPFTSLDSARKASNTLSGYGDVEIRRVESLDRTIEAIESEAGRT